MLFLKPKNIGPSSEDSSGTKQTMGSTARFLNVKDYKSGCSNKNSSFTRPEAEPSFDKFRSKENAENLKNKLEKGCVSFWNDDVDVLIENSEPQKILQKAIKRKIAADCLNYPEKFTWMV